MTRPSIDQQITFLRADDLDVTTRFYRDLLGLPMVLDQEACRIFRTTADAYLGFCTHIEPVGEGRNVILTLVTEDVVKYYNHLVNNGVEALEPPQYNAKYNIEHFFVGDPNGYLVEIQRFHDPNWNKSD